MKQTFTLIIYKALDWLKQESPFWWAVVQILLWSSFGIISTNWVNFKGEEVVLVFLGGLISSVGSRTTKKLSENQSPVSVDPNKFRDNVETKLKEIQKPVFKKESKIIQKYLPEGQWIQEITSKKQIYIHHTSGGSWESTWNWWAKGDKQRIATHFLIERDGTIIQNFPLEHWAYHLGISTNDNKIPSQYKKNDKKLNQESISIEICSWGGLVKKKGKYYSWSNQEVTNVDTTDYTFRSFEYFEKYTPEQIASLKNLLEQLSKDFNVPLNPITFDINYEALQGKPGLYTHVEVKTSKSDCYPNKDLISMLKDLTNATT